MRAQRAPSPASTPRRAASAPGVNGRENVNARVGRTRGTPDTTADAHLHFHTSICAHHHPRQARRVVKTRAIACKEQLGLNLAPGCQRLGLGTLGSKWYGPRRHPSSRAHLRRARTPPHTAQSPLRPDRHKKKHKKSRLFLVHSHGITDASAWRCTLRRTVNAHTWPQSRTCRCSHRLIKQKKGATVSR